MEEKVGAGRQTQSAEFYLKPNWSTSSVYGDVNRSDPTSATFVGRPQLLNGLVDAMADPLQRGALLISGYRGVGKSTLVIEAARRARLRLSDRQLRLLPVVLNVSHVSASIPEAADDGERLPISPRRLLIALLRALHRQEFDVACTPEQTGGDGDKQSVAAQISSALERATADAYVAEHGRARSASDDVVTETRARVEVTDVWKLLAGVAVVIGVSLGGVALWDSVRAAAGAAAVGIASVVALGFAISRTSKTADSKTQQSSTTVTETNSLQRIELDVQDILLRLAEAKRRTIVIFEELDKLEDDDGRQLADLIYYFKNLFTQAQALFVFVTDKRYFDFVTKRMEQERAGLSYAVEHTFFTQRIFVPRMMIAECYEFLRQSIVDGDVCAAIDRIEAADSDRVRNVEEMDDLEQFVRLLLFRAEGHLFDLKNELRRHVRIPAAADGTEDGSPPVLVVNAPLSARERMMATLHFLIESKVRSYSFGGGRTYANETLRNHLAAVVKTIGCGQTMRHIDLVPGVDHASYDLTNGEIASIGAAVASLLDDLTTGGALERVDETDHEPQYRWLPRAEFDLRLRGALEQHEVLLEKDLADAVRVARLFGTDGVLSSVADEPTEAIDERATSWQHEQEGLLGSPRAETEEVTEERRRELRRDVDILVQPAIDRHVDRLRSYGWKLTPVQSDGRLWEFSPDGISEILLAYGLDDRTLRSILDTHGHVHENSEAAGDHFVVLVDVRLRAGGDAVGSPSRQAGLSQRQVRVLRTDLAETGNASGFDESWGRQTSLALFAAERWIEAQYRALRAGSMSERGPERVHLLRETTSADDLEDLSLQAAIDLWLHGPEQYLGWIDDISRVDGSRMDFAVEDRLARLAPEAWVVVTAERAGHGGWDSELTQLEQQRRLILIDQLHFPLDGLYPTAKRVQSLRSIIVDQGRTNGVAVVAPAPFGSTSDLGVEVEAFHPSVGRELLQRSANAGDLRAIRRLLQIGVWGPADLDDLVLSEPADLVLMEAADDPDYGVEASVRTNLLIGALRKGSIPAEMHLRQLVDGPLPGNEDNALIGDAAYAIATAGVDHGTRNRMLAIAAERNHVPALRDLLEESLRQDPEGWDKPAADRLVHLGHAVDVATIVGAVDAEAERRYLDLGVRRDQPAAMRSLASLIQGEDADAARRLRELADEREGSNRSADVKNVVE